MKRTLLLLTFGLSFISLSQNCFNTGTGTDGAYVASSTTTLVGGIYNFTSFTIDPGVVVTVTGTAPLEIYCQGSVIINGTLSVNGANGSNGVTSTSAGIGGIGVAGGGNGGDGSYSVSSGELPGIDGFNTGGANTHGAGWSGGGGAGYGTVGQASGGSSGGFAGVAYGTADLVSITSGSGGGGGSGGFSCGAGGGGAGGGIIIFHAPSVTVSAGAVISANGGNGGSDGGGNCGGGGAGSGGTIWIETGSLLNNGSISAIGGLGGGSTVGGSPFFGVGGNGAVGRIRMDGTISGSGMIAPAVGFYGTSPTVIAVTSQSLSICFQEVVIVGSNTYSATGFYVDTIQTIAGCDSIIETDLTVFPQIQTTQSLSICDGESVVIGSSTYSTPGTYTDVLSAQNGCDSTVITNLSVDVIDVSVDNTVNVLTANSSVGSYQWLDCDDNNLPISGETNQVYSPTDIGNYAVVITVGSCSDTSECVLVDFADLNENALALLSIYPNPNTGIVFVKGMDKITGFELLEIHAASGELVAVFSELKASYDLSKLNAGVYFLAFKLSDRTETIRLLKQ